MASDMYRLIAYDIETGGEVLKWLNVAPIARFHKGSVIVEGACSWEVLGVRNTSTKDLWLVDVRPVRLKPPAHYRRVDERSRA